MQLLHTLVQDLIFSNYLNIIYIPNSGELFIFCLATVGSCIGFLWYNAHPAKIFMGDTGSLALGAALGTLAILLKKEILLIIVGGVFVLESLSVILQVLYFKYTKRKYGNGKKIFKMAPLHHHFELSGWSENHVVVRFMDNRNITCIIFINNIQIAIIMYTRATNNINITNKKISIIGYGISGIGAAHLALHLGAKVFISEKKTINKSDELIKKVSFEEGNHTSKCYDCDFAIVSPGIDTNNSFFENFRKKDIPIISEIEFASWFSKSTIIGITGSNGKSTTVSLLYSILAKKIQGELILAEI